MYLGFEFHVYDYASFKVRVIHNNMRHLDSFSDILISNQRNSEGLCQEYRPLDFTISSINTFIVSGINS